jgi:hypothetical protein
MRLILSAPLSVFVLFTILGGHAESVENGDQLAYFSQRIFSDINFKDCNEAAAADRNECELTQLYIARTSIKFVSVMKESYTTDIFRRFGSFSALADYIDPSPISAVNDVFTQFSYLNWARTFDTSLNFIICNLNEKRLKQKTDSTYHWPKLFRDARDGLVAACSPLSVSEDALSIAIRLYSYRFHRELIPPK